MTRLAAGLLFLCLAFALVFSDYADAGEVLGARYPALSPDGETVAFEYWGDLWSMPVDGALSRRGGWPTTGLGLGSHSPDGEEIAFVSDRSGNQDVWVIPAQGGAARQVTTFSGDDVLCGWSPDGARLLFYSQRGLWAHDMYSVDARGAEPPAQLTQNDHFNAIDGALDPQGNLVYARGTGRWWRKGYRGTAQYDLWSLSPAGEYQQLTTHSGKDMWPMLAAGGAVMFYVSDEDGIDNIWRLDRSSTERRQLTQFKDDGVQWPSIAPDGGMIVFEHGGGLYTLDTTGGQPQQLAVTIAAEGKDNSVVKRSFENEADEYAVSPHGKYIVVVHAGDLWAVKDPDAYDEDEQPDQDLAEAWRLTASDNARELYPAFAPDNRQLAYASDADGDYEIFVMDLNDMSTRQVTDNAVDDLQPAFDPANSNLLFYYSGNRELLRQDLESGKTNRVAAGRFRGSFGNHGFSVSPDGAWVAYTEELFDWSGEVFIADSAGEQTPVNIVRHPGWDSDPQWSADGRRLIYRGDHDDEVAIYVIDLDPEPETYDLEYLFADDRPDGVKTDEDTDQDEDDADDVNGDEDDAEDDNGDDADEDDEEDKGQECDKEVKVTIDFKDIHLRARRVTSQEGARQAQISNDGEWVVYNCNPDGEGGEIWAVKAEGGDAAKLFDGDWDNPRIAAKGKRVYYRDGGEVKYMKFSDGQSKARETIQAKGEFWLNRQERWRQMYREGWRTLGERFYDAEMHGADWNAVYAKYRPFIDSIATPEEFGLIFEELLGELNASHLAISLAESSYDGEGKTTGQLGLEFDPDFAGPGLKVSHVTYQGPADQPGVEISEGDVVVSIAGAAVDTSMRWQELLDDTDGRPLRLEVLRAGAAEPDEIVLKPISYSAYQGLLYREWEIANERRVDELSAGRIGYIHIRGMSRRELRKFEREFLSEFFDKEALIVDVRFNPGGWIHEDLFGLLDRNPFAFCGPRDSSRTVQPARAFLKPKALLINSRSGSDAEIFPAGWRILGLGPIIGIDTAGAVIGTSGFRLVDGSWVRLPMEGWWELDGRNLEQSGTPPDIYIDVDPAELRAGRDAQLDKAVEVLLAALAEEGCSQ